MAQKEDREIAKIKNFLAKDLAEFRVKHRAKRLITTPREIAEHTGLDIKIVKRYLSRTPRRVNEKLVVVRVGNTDVIIRLAGRAPRLPLGKR